MTSGYVWGDSTENTFTQASFLFTSRISTHSSFNNVDVLFLRQTPFFGISGKFFSLAKKLLVHWPQRHDWCSDSTCLPILRLCSKKQVRRPLVFQKLRSCNPHTEPPRAHSKLVSMKKRSFGAKYYLQRTGLLFRCSSGSSFKKDSLPWEGTEIGTNKRASAAANGVRDRIKWGSKKGKKGVVYEI